MDHTSAYNDHPAAECDLLLAKVNLTYQDIDTIYGQLVEEITVASPVVIEEKLTLLDDLMAEAKTLDEVISKHLVHLSTFCESTGKLLIAREQMVKELYRTNRNIVSRAENVKILLQHEIKSMNKNHHALQGYRPNATDCKSILRESY